MEDILKTIVSFRSVTGDTAENTKLIDWTAKQCAAHMRVRRFLCKGIPSLVATSRRGMNPRLMLAAHGDVVPAPAQMFSLLKKGGKFIGRGVFDMKFALACYVRLVWELGAEISNYEIGIMVTADEEVGGACGTKYLLTRGVRPGFVFLPDGGANWEVEREGKGIVHLELDVKGATAHGSRPWEGEHPLPTVLAFVHALKKYFSIPLTCGTTCFHHHGTCEIASIKGGEASNQIPGSMHVVIDLRYLLELSAHDVEERIFAAQQQEEFCNKVDITVCSIGTAVKHDLSRAEVLAYKRIAGEEGVELKDTLSHGSSDARHLMAAGIESLIVRPAGGGQHSNKEWVGEQDLERYYCIMKRWALELAKIR